MTVAFYIAPYEQLFAKGGGTFGLTEPGRPVNGSRCLIYAAWDQAQGTRCSTLIPIGRNGTSRAICITRVEASDAIHASIEADSTIRRLPITRENLTLTVGDLDTQLRSNLQTRLEAIGFDTTWITLSTTLRQIIVALFRFFLCLQFLGTDFPGIDLDSRITTIPASIRNRLSTFLTDRGISIADLDNNSTIRQLVRKFGEVRWGKITLGSDEFED